MKIILNAGFLLSFSGILFLSFFRSFVFFVLSLLFKDVFSYLKGRGTGKK